MSSYRVPLYLIVAASLAIGAGAAGAQVITDENSRGVRVLEAEPDPAPAPKPVPAPKPAPTPAPAPVIRPAPAPMPTPVLKFCERPFAQPDLQLSDGTGFDRDLAARLNAGKRVVIDLPQPYNDDAAAPAAIAPWLSEVKAGGGTVTVKEYCEAARGSLGAWIAKLFGGPKPAAASVYRPARRFNVILHADALDKVITQVEFAPKSARAAL